MNSKISKRLTAFILFIIILISGWLYRSSFGAYFFQDDWFSLRIGTAVHFSDFLKFFIPRTDVIYYRPLGMQVPFFILSSLFGINPLPFRLLTFATHALNIILVYILVYLLTGRKTESLLASFFYATSLCHYIIFFWSAIYAFIASVSTFLISVIFFILFCQRKKNKYFFISIISFILGLLINEIVITLLAILFLYITFFVKNNSGKIKRYLYLLPYLFSGASLFIIRFLIFPPPLSGSYRIGITKRILSNLEGYLLWSFNLPEEIKAQLVNFHTVNSRFIADFPVYFYVFMITLAASLCLFYILPAIFISWQKKIRLIPIILFGFSWFIIGLLPVIFFPEHSFSYYLSIPIVGLILSSVVLLTNFLRGIPYRFRWLSYLLVFIMLSSWLFSGYMTVDFNVKVHWAPRRAKLAKELVEKAKQTYNFSGSDFSIYVTSESENKLALNDQDAFKLIFGNDKIMTRYTQYSNGKKVL